MANKMFEVGDIAKVKSCKNAHRFKIGSIVTITYKSTEDYQAVDKFGEKWWITDEELKKINKTMRKKANVKMDFRKGAKVQIVGDTMNHRFAKGSKVKITQVDSSDGTYEATDGKNTFWISKKDVAAIKTNVTNTKSERISRTKAKSMMENSKGQFFTVSFIKKKGEIRTMNCQYRQDMPQRQAHLGYITVMDIVEKAPKNVNTQTMKALKISGVNYQIR